jgi:DNA polymerase I
MPAQPKKKPASAARTRDHVFLVDGSSYIFRAYFAMFKAAQARGRAFVRSDGLPVGAVMTFTNMLWKLVRDGLEGTKPTHVGVVFDYSGESFRNAIYPQYKANRDEPPQELIPQFPLMREAVKAFGFTPIEEEGYEADDLIATYTRAALAAGADVTIVAGDKDMMQLIRPGVTMYDPMPGRERRIGPNEVVEKFGVAPDKVAEVQSLAGDSTDNVPGVPGIGIKTAAALIQEYGDLETLLSRASEIKQEKRRESLIQFAEQARVSKKLVVLKDDAPVHIPLGQLHLDGVDPKRLVAFLKAMEFTSLTNRVAEACGLDADAIDPDRELKAGSAAIPTLEARARAEVEDLDEQEKAPAPSPVATTATTLGNVFYPSALAAARAREAKATKVDRSKYETVTTLAQLDRWIAKATERGVVAFDTETTSLDAMQADLCGVSLALSPNEACYIPFAHRESDDLLAGGGLKPGQMPIREGLARLKPLLENPAVLKVAQNFKFDFTILSRHGIDTTPFDDTLLMSYALDAGKNNHGMDELSELHLAHRTITFHEVTGKGKGAICFDRIELARATEYAAEDADVTLRLWRLFKGRLPAESMDTVYETLERPLAPVLARMERRGIAIDRQMLARLSGEFAQIAARLEHEIAEIAGVDFNPGSAKQLGDILFGKMGLPGGIKTPTGAWSTKANVLEDLAEEGHALPKKILEWRSLTKLKSTYTDALPSYVNPETGRVHTSYALASTTTGRLSSSDPNLQNIPIRTEEGRKIRRAFVAETGHKLVSADYSQIELRLLAEIADIAPLKKAFREGLDIHAMTASEMFGVPVKDMAPDVRRRAKAINFGIIYGISAFGLANQLGITREEAGAYIKKYFERFPGIRAYMDETKAFCRKHGYVTTLFGRKCHYPEIKSSNPSMRAFMERAAINARLQGTAADIIRRAMVRMDGALADAKLNAKMLLQVHDELVFEVPEKEVAKTLPVVAKVMTDAPLPAVSLSVPLHVDARAADNWDEAH